MHGTAAPYGTGRSLVFAYAVFTAVCAFILLISGGLVTSKGVGMTVPDWPNSYGYNMFTFPISRWVGGIFYEHAHRLIASGVGLLTVILAVLLWFAEPRRWVRVLGYIAVAAVIVQGVLGGLRVVLIKDEIGIFHGMLAQAYISSLVVIAIALSKAFATGGARWAVGDRFTGLNRARVSWRTQCRVVAAQSERRFAFDVSFGPFPIARWAFELQALPDGGTFVTQRWTDRRDGVLGALAKPAGLPVGRGYDAATRNRQTMRATLDALKADLESAN